MRPVLIYTEISYLIILMFNSKSLSQIPEHKWAVLLKLKMSREVFPKKHK